MRGHPLRSRHVTRDSMFLRRRSAVLRAVRWFALGGCAGLTGCVSDELVKVVLAQNIALTAAGFVQTLLGGLVGAA